MGLLDEVATKVNEVSTKIGDPPAAGDHVFSALGGLNTAVGGVGTAVGGVAGAVGGVAGAVGGVAGAVGGVKDFLTAGGHLDLGAAIKAALKDFIDTTEHLLEKPLGDFVDNIVAFVGTHEGPLKDFLKKLLKLFVDILGDVADELQKIVVCLVKIIFEALLELAKAFLDVLEKETYHVTKEVGKLATRVVSIMKALWDEVEKLLSSITTDFPLQCGAKFGIKAALELCAFLKVAGLLEDIQVRVTVVGASLIALLDAIGATENVLIIKSAIELFIDALNVICGLAGAQTEVQIVEKILLELLFPKGLLSALLQSAAEGKWWAWAQLPCGFEAGKLHKWINDFGDLDVKLVPLARQFRLRMVSVLDAYFRGRVEVSTPAFPITISDARLSYEATADVVCAMVECIISFTFEPQCFPHLDIELDGFEDLGAKFAVIYSRQIRVVIRGGIGLLLRGIWVFSVQNDVLIEFIGALIGVSFSAFIEASLRNLTWTTRVMSRYEGDAELAGILNWPTNDGVLAEDGFTISKKLEYVVLLRDSVDTTGFEVGGTLQGLLKDYGAYLDACYGTFRLSPCFPDVVTDTITISSANIPVPVDGVDTYLIVEAFSSAYDEKPRPVLRVYFGCHILIMKPPQDEVSPYTLKFKLLHIYRRLPNLTVLSNRGGTATIPGTDITRL